MSSVNYKDYPRHMSLYCEDFCCVTTLTVLGEMFGLFLHKYFAFWGSYLENK